MVIKNASRDGQHDDDDDREEEHGLGRTSRIVGGYVSSSHGKHRPGRVLPLRRGVAIRAGCIPFAAGAGDARIARKRSGLICVECALCLVKPTMAVTLARVKPTRVTLAMPPTQSPIKAARVQRTHRKPAIKGRFNQKPPLHARHD